MDIWELEPITKRMDKALISFYQSRDYNELQIVEAGLNELAPRHICFELLDPSEKAICLLCVVRACHAADLRQTGETLMDGSAVKPHHMRQQDAHRAAMRQSIQTA